MGSSKDECAAVDNRALCSRDGVNLRMEGLRSDMLVMDCELNVECFIRLCL